MLFDDIGYGKFQDGLVAEGDFEEFLAAAKHHIQGLLSFPGVLLVNVCVIKEGQVQTIL